MGFGNPYGDPYSAQLAIDYVGKITGLGIQTVAMSDTIGVADPDNIDYVFSQLIPAFPDIEIGAHFHSTPHTRIEKLAAAYQAGCTRFDSSINGIGGCPMAKDELVGNMATETLVSYFEQQGVLPSLNRSALDQAMAMAPGVFR